MLRSLAIHMDSATHFLQNGYPASAFRILPSATKQKSPDAIASGSFVLCDFVCLASRASLANKKYSCGAPGWIRTSEAHGATRLQRVCFDHLPTDAYCCLYCSIEIIPKSERKTKRRWGAPWVLFFRALNWLWFANAGGTIFFCQLQ